MVKEGNPIGGGGEGIGTVKEVEGGSSRESSAGGDVVESRVWTMQDLYKHPSARGYSRDLYNFAWARAVQKKPLNEAVLSNVVVSNGDESLKGSEDRDVVKLVAEIKESSEGFVADGGDQNQAAVDKVESECDEGESEKEEGELEEGEIDFEVKEEDVSNDANVQTDDSCKEEKEEDVSNDAVEAEMEIDCGQIDAMDFDERMLTILDTLESVSVAEVEKSFEVVCSELINTLKSMRELVLVLAVPAMDTLVQLFLTAVTTVYTVFSSMDQDQKEQHKEISLRLLSKIKSQRPIFSQKQIQDIQDMMPKTVGSDSRGVSYKDINDSKVAVKENTDFAQFPKKTLTSSLVNGYPSNNDLMDLPGTLKISTSRSKGMAPLLDLHKDHDLDSLPSPTSKPTPEFSRGITIPAGNRVSHKVLGSTKDSSGTPSAVTNSFRTEALKAFSSYQQTFGNYERLPSPTPSEDNEGKDNDCHGEVSSDVFPPSHVSPSLSPSISTAPSKIGDVQRASTVVTPVLSSSINTTNTNPARSRDPRLRYAGLDVGSLDVGQRLLVGNNASGAEPTGGPAVHQSKVNNRRVEGSDLDGPASKRQRNEFSNPSNTREKISRVATGGWLEDNGTRGTISTTKNQAASTGNKSRDPRAGVSGYSNGAPRPVSETARLNFNIPAFLPPGLLENIAVNPTILFELMKNNSQQNLVREPLQKLNDPGTQTKNSGVADSVVWSMAHSSVSSQQSAAVISTPGDKGMIRMKPRDPRRVLLSGNFQSPTLTMGASVESIANIRYPESRGNLKTMSSQVATTADTAMKNPDKPLNVPKTIECPQIDTNSLVASKIQTDSTMDERKTDACSMSENAVAGVSESPATWGDVEHLFDGYDEQQRAAIQKERTRRLDEQKKMFAEHKLCLVLDLDHTLLNSAKFCDIDPAHEELLRKKEEQDREKPYRHLFRFPHMAMWTKLRPGIWNFLEKASKLFEMHLYTMGNKSYASEMAKILDPKGVLFAGRVISRGDDGDSADGDDRISKTKDLEGVLGMESSVVIIDDSIRVWPHNKLNLIVVERYIFFPCSRRQFGLPGPSLLEIDHDERPEDGTLASSLAVIERLHKNFFSHRELDEVDVRAILAAEQQKILGGCRIVFSRVFPVGEASPHFHPLWQTAEQFGATCTNQIDDKVTHVVANSLGTDKVKWALSTGRYVVHPNWVEASALLYRRANEQDFAIKQ